MAFTITWSNPASGIITYCFIYWIWLIYLSWLAERKILSSRGHQRIYYISRQISILTLLFAAVLFMSMFSGGGRLVFYILRLYTVGVFLIPAVFLITMLLFILELRVKINLNNLEDDPKNRVFALILLPLGLWVICLNKRKREIFVKLEEKK